ncbi:MAG: helix-turn-helix domain-containing protein [Chloroflexota bacterium]|nr:helix-turn-helix domain-containing protein [Chloroflexota bacterium]
MDEHSTVDYLTVQDVAARLQVHEETVRRWIRDGAMPIVDLGRKAGYRIKRDDLDTFIAARYKTLPTRG